MLLERAELQIKDGMEAEFAAMMNNTGIPMLVKDPGVKSVKLGRGVENPNKFLLLVEWAAISAHEDFKKGTVYPEFGALFRPFSKGGAMEHFEFN